MHTHKKTPPNQIIDLICCPLFDLVSIELTPFFKKSKSCLQHHIFCVAPTLVDSNALSGRKSNKRKYRL